MLPLAAFYEARRLLFWSIHGYALFPLRRKCMQTEKPPRSPETAPQGKRAAAGCRIAHTHIHNAASDLPPFILSCFGFFGISAPSQYIATGHHSIDQTLSFATRFRKMDHQSYPCQKQLPKEHGGACVVITHPTIPSLCIAQHIPPVPTAWGSDYIGCAV